MGIVIGLLAFIVVAFLLGGLGLITRKAVQKVDFFKIKKDCANVCVFCGAGFENGEAVKKNGGSWHRECWDEMFL